VDACRNVKVTEANFQLWKINIKLEL
jgi:hypothetical protein